MSLRGFRLAAIPLAATLVFFASGCASVFEKDYLVVAPYEIEIQEDDWSMDTVIQDYRGLMRALNRLVADHAEQGTLTFSNYDGDINNDLAIARDEVRTSTALGAYVVDYISYDISRIVSYYEAAVSVVYKRTEAEAKAIVSLSGTAEFREALYESLANGRQSLAVSISTGLIDEAAVKTLAEQLYYDNPLDIVVKPRVKASVYPEGGIQRIIDIAIDYGLEREDFLAMKSSLSYAAVNAIWELEPWGEKPSEALRACLALAARADYNKNADSANADTAYGALVEGEAASEGFAMAYKALCDTLEIECVVVKGRYEKDEHFWCVIKLEDGYYHVDPAHFTLDYAAERFMRSDADMWGTYIWDTDAYPVCEGGLSYYDAAPPSAITPSEQ